MELNISSFERQIAAGDRLLLDLSVLIAYFESADETHDVAAAIIDEYVRSGRNPAVVAALTAMEFLVKPLRAAPRSVIHIHDFLTHWPNLRVAPFDLELAQTAASLRANHDFEAPDALVVATGLGGDVSHLLTTDAAWAQKLAPIGSHLRAVTLAAFAG